MYTQTLHFIYETKHKDNNKYSVEIKLNTIRLLNQSIHNKMNMLTPPFIPPSYTKVHIIYVHMYSTGVCIY